MIELVITRCTESIHNFVSYMHLSEMFVSFQKAYSTSLISTWQGTVKQTLPLDEAHGSASCVDVHGDTLAVATTTSFIKLWRINGRDLKPVGPGAGRRVEMGPDPPGPIVSIRCNCTGSKVRGLCRNRGAFFCVSIAIAKFGVNRVNSEASRNSSAIPSSCDTYQSSAQEQSE